MKTLTRSAMLLAALLVCAAPSVALAAGKPGATTGGSKDVSPSAATIAGTVRPNGLVTTWYFQYGKTGKYGARTAALDAGSGSQPVTVGTQLTSLAADTTYHYRLVATNSAGSAQGADRTFKTPQIPTVSTIATAPNPSIFGQPVVVGGFLVGPKGGGGKQVALEGNGFPFTAGFQQIGNTVVTASNGGYQFLFSPVTVIQLRVVDKSDTSIVSPVVTQNVAPVVTLRTRRRSAKKVVRFSGYVTPIGSASVVVIQRRTGSGGWTDVASALPRNGAAGHSSAFSVRKRVKKGVFRAVARPGGGAFVEGTSNLKRVR